MLMRQIRVFFIPIHDKILYCPILNYNSFPMLSFIICLYNSYNVTTDILLNACISLNLHYIVL